MGDGGWRRMETGDGRRAGESGEWRGDMAGLLPLVNELFIQFTRLWDQFC